MSEWQAWCLGAKVGNPRPSKEEAWAEVFHIGVTLYPQDRLRRRAFEDLCVMARVVPLSSIPESATEVPIMAGHCITRFPSTPSQSRTASR